MTKKKEQTPFDSFTIEMREERLVDMAERLAYQKLKDGTASSQLICHYLDLGSKNTKLKNQKLEEENRLLRAKTENLESLARSEEMAEKALAAFRAYSGNGPDEDYEEELS